MQLSNPRLAYEPKPGEEYLCSSSDAELLKSIRRDLSSIYSDVLQQPVPSHIADLIAKLSREVES
jgi:hypothetical protein